MGTVYRALDRKANREVAIKFISPAIAQQEVFLNRFRREVKAVARLHHPHVVPVLDYGEQSGYAYLVMPLLEVATLLDRLQAGPLSLELGARVMDQVSAALEHAHRHGIIHRDVKPSNILLDQQDNARLSDFGLARFYDAAASLTGSGLVGTPAYMAPEQARGGPVDARCDQYALGVVLFYLATGSLPFTATSHLEYLLKHVNEPFPAARARNPRVPESVERVIFKATAKNRDDRFASVSEMNHALQAAIVHALDPITHEAPTVELPGAFAPEWTVSPRAVPSGRTVLGRGRRSPLRIAAAAVAGVLLILAVPVFASGLLNLLQRAASPAEGSLSSLELAQLTLQAGTIEAMSTELARSQSDPEAIQTAIALTLDAAARTPAAEGDGTSEAGPTDTVALAGLLLTPTGGPGANQGLQAASPTQTVSVRSAQTAGPDSTPGGTSTNPPVPPSATQSPAASIVPTDTSAGPTATATRTPTPSPTATQSPVPTPVPTNPPTPLPTAVPTQDPCTLLDLGGFEVSGNEASWNLSNDGTSSVVIEGIALDWPAGNGELDRIRFGSSTIWNGSDAAPPSDISSGFTGNHSLGGGSKALKFEFTEDAGPGGYALQLQLDPGCQLSGGG